jgi:transposase InsO family protein
MAQYGHRRHNARIETENGRVNSAAEPRSKRGISDAKTAYIIPDSPRENGYCESFNLKLRDELLNGDIFHAQGGKIIIEGWRQHDNTVRPHSSLNYKPPAPEATVWPRQNRPASTPAVAARPSIR